MSNKDSEIIKAVEFHLCVPDKASKKIKPYHKTKLLGIPVGIVDTIVTETCETCGEEMITVPNTKGLIAAVAVVRIMHAHKLNGSEIKLLRKFINLRANRLATMLGVRAETVSRWESNIDQQIGDSDEKLLRLVIRRELKEHVEDGDRVPAIDCDVNDILDMPLRSVKLSSRAVWANFLQTRIKVNKKNQLAWDIVETT